MKESYLAGLIDGDGHIETRNRRVELVNKDPILLDVATEYLRDLDIYHYRYDNLVVPKVIVSRKENLHYFYRVIPLQSIKREQLRKCLGLPCSTKYKTFDSRGYLAGFIDAEGYVSKQRTNRCIFIGNKDKALLYNLGTICTTLDLTYTLCISNKVGPYFALIIRSRENLEQVLHSVPIMSKHKLQALQENCSLMRRSSRKPTRVLV